ncbi:hypothetical protein, partial [Bacillus thuringiensis]|uniref:hypothetical protein n=1 Tax=Bacillus thuringiensis TaxID=1428 RepID=UPI00119DFE8E
MRGGLGERGRERVIGGRVGIAGEEEVVELYRMGEKEEGMVWGKELYEKWMRKISGIEKQQL